MKATVHAALVSSVSVVTLTIVVTFIAFWFAPVHASRGMEDHDSTGTLEEQFDRIAEHVPQFAGVSGDSARLVIYLTEESTGRATEVRTLAAQILGDPALAEAEIQVEEVPYSWQQLRRWSAELRPSVWALSGVTSFGIDEVGNNIIVGVTDVSAAESEVIQVATATGIPTEVVKVELSPLPAPDAEGGRDSSPVSPLAFALVLFLMLAVYLPLRAFRR